MAASQVAQKGKETHNSHNIWSSITLEELQKHADVDNHNAWMAVNGVVYDVSAYAAVHPGGIEKIRKYAGKDATETFKTVHPYVDINHILGDFRVGVLKGDPHAPRRNLLSRLTNGKLSCCDSESKYVLPISSFKQDSIIAVYIVDFLCKCTKWDWTIGLLDHKVLYVFKCIDHKKGWLSVYKLPTELFNDELTVEYKNDAQLAEIVMRKPIPGTCWADQMHGLRQGGKFVSLRQSYCSFDAFIIYKKTLTPNILMFGIQIVNSAKVRVPIGFHVNMQIEDVVRPYTPVCFTIINPTGGSPAKKSHKNKIVDDEPTILYFMIKIYSKGKLSRALDDIDEDDGEEIPTMKISTPYGCFNPEFIEHFGLLLLICGGTGITPMIRILRSFYEMREMWGKQVALIYFCDKDYQLIWRKQFTELDQGSNWFHYVPVLTHPSAQSKWSGLWGKINPQLARNVIDQIPHDKSRPMKALICGPPGFNRESVTALHGIVKMENIFVFTN